MIELIITIIICSTIVVVTSALTKNPLTITVVHKEATVKANEDISLLKEQQEALDDYYKKNAEDIPTYDDVLAEVNAMLKGEDVNG